MSPIDLGSQALQVRVSLELSSKVTGKGFSAYELFPVESMYVSVFTLLW